MSAAEVLDWVNEQDQPVGTIQRGDIFRVHANFMVAHVFIFDGAGKLLLQRLAPSRSRHPGCWGSSLAAYVAAGENYAAAATRRLSEELSVTNVGLREIGKTSMFDDGCVKFITLYEPRRTARSTLIPRMSRTSQLSLWTTFDAGARRTLARSRPRSFTCLTSTSKRGDCKKHGCNQR